MIIIKKINLVLTVLMLCMHLGGNSQSSVPEQSLQVAYYPFSGNTDDFSGNNYDATTVNGNPALTTDRFGNNNAAYNFDGVDDWMYFGNAMLSQFTNNNDSFTTSVWAKSTTSGSQDLITYGGMVSCGGGRYGAIARLNSTISFNSCNASFDTPSGGANSDGNWHQYVFVWTKSIGRKIYKDGVQIGTDSDANAFRIINHGLALGRGFMDFGLGTLFNGSVDELRLWKIALSGTDVLNLYTYENNIANTFSGVSKNGAIRNLKSNYINKYGAINTGDGVSVKGAIMFVKDGLSAATAGTSAYQIKQDLPASPDGVYWITNPNINGGIAFQVYADMTTDGGGWMLLNVGSGSSGSSQVSAVTSPDVQGYLSRSKVIELAKISTAVQLRAGGSSSSYAHKATSTDPLAIGALRDASTAAGVATWHNGAQTTFVVDSGTWCWSTCCAPTITGWPNMYHSNNFGGCVHWYVGMPTGRGSGGPDSWFSTWIK